MNYLLDTCVISELVRPAPDPGVVRWVRVQEEESLFLSMTIVTRNVSGMEASGAQLFNPWGS